MIPRSTASWAGLILFLVPPALAQGDDREVEALRRRVAELERTVEDLERQLAEARRERDEPDLEGAIDRLRRSVEARIADRVGEGLRRLEDGADDLPPGAAEGLRELLARLREGLGAEAPATADVETAWQEDFDLSACTHRTTGRNRYFVLEPGYQIVLASESEQVFVTVLDETVEVDGIATRVVEEKEYEDGRLKEVSRNFVTIGEPGGDVWYHGEDVDVYEDGEVVRHDGAWRAGLDGARAGLLLPGDARPGLRHYQEIAPGRAMDRAEVLGVDRTFETPQGKFHGCLEVVETSPLEPGDESIKVYAPEVGMVLDDDLVLVDRGTGRKSPEGPIAPPRDLKGFYAENEIDPGALPEVVAAILAKRHPDGRIHEVKRERRRSSQVVYAIEIFVDGKQWDVEVTPEGEVLRDEEE